MIFIEVFRPYLVVDIESGILQDADAGRVLFLDLHQKLVQLAPLLSQRSRHVLRDLGQVYNIPIPGLLRRTDQTSFASL